MVEKDIFEDLKDNIEDCYYISDLRNVLRLQGSLRLLRAVEQINFDDYTLNQWCEMSEYVLMKKINCTSKQEAYDYIKEELKKSASLSLK